MVADARGLLTTPGKLATFSPTLKDEEMSKKLK
jgi:hypothetical protein